MTDDTPQPDPVPEDAPTPGDEPGISDSDTDALGAVEREAGSVAEQAMAISRFVQSAFAAAAAPEDPPEDTATPQ